MAIEVVTAEMTVLSAVSHIDEALGTESIFRREKFVMPDGTIETVPVISGNSIRGQLRDAAALHLFETLELPQVSLSAFYLLFSGGSLVKSGSRAIRLDDARALRELIPPLSLFGGATGNYILPGKLDIGMLIPIARETAYLLPYVDRGQEALPSVYDLLQATHYVRTDDAKNPRLAGLARDPFAEVRDAPGYEGESAPTGGAQQMRYVTETLAVGATLAWWVAFREVTDIERQAFVAALAYWGRQPKLGGKSAVGHGLVDVRFANGWRVAPGQVELPDVTDYEAYLRQYRDAIVELLDAI